MKSYKEMSKEELSAELESLNAEYQKYLAMNLTLDMSRGKPCKEQLDISMGMMDVLNSKVDLRCEDGTDCRNYGCLDGIPEAKQLMGDMMENHPDNIIIYGNSSLNVMYDTVARAMTHGIMGNTPPVSGPTASWAIPPGANLIRLSFCALYPAMTGILPLPNISG